MLGRNQAPALLSAVLAAALIAACGTPVALRTAPAKQDNCDAALTAGELVASSQSGLAIRRADGVIEVVWPFGYSATREATGLVLRDATGKVVAHEGQRVQIGGGQGANDTWIACGLVEEVSNTDGG